MNKKAIVTGASRGIGRSIALKLAALGYDLAISYHSKEAEAAEVVEIIQHKYGRACYAFQASLEKRSEGRLFFDKAVEALGGLDLLVNNAGISLSETILDMKEETLDLLVDLEFKNCLLMMQAAARYMVKHEIRGNIINITSSRGMRAYPGTGMYGGVKAGLMHASESIALDLAPYGIRVNNVAPGCIQVRTRERLDEKTPAYIEVIEKLGPKVPIGRIGQPEDVANAVAFLASDEASYITGISLRTDGGLILPGMPEVENPNYYTRGWGWRPSEFAKHLNEKNKP